MRRRRKVRGCGAVGKTKGNAMVVHASLRWTSIAARPGFMKNVIVLPALRVTVKGGSDVDPPTHGHLWSSGEYSSQLGSVRHGSSGQLGHAFHRARECGLCSSVEEESFTPPLHLFSLYLTSISPFHSPPRPFPCPAHMRTFSVL